jgi:protein-disulfide isomerase
MRMANVWAPLRAVIAAGAGLIALAAAPAQAQSFTAQEQAEIRAVVRDYLVRNPEVLEEAIQVLQDRRADALWERMRTYPSAFTMGPANAPVTIVEFFDYRCPYCHRAMDWLFETMRTRRDVRVVFMELPSLGPQSAEAARAAIASIPQGRYQAFHQRLMAHAGDLDSATIDRIAREAGLDVARLRRDMRSEDIDRILDETQQMAAEAGGRGTPLFMINGDPMYGFEPTQLTQMVERAARAAREAR